MSVTKRGNRWIARWKIDGRHVSRSFDLKDDAERWETGARRRAQMGAHTPVEPSRDALKTWLDTWWERDAHGWARSTRLGRGYLIDKWVDPFIGGVRMRDLGAARVRDFRAEITREGASNHTANQVVRVLSAVLGAAVRDGLLPSNPCAGLRKLPVMKGRPRAMTPEEVERVRVAMPTVRDVVILGLMAYAGLRPEEVLALRWSDIGPNVVTIDRAWTHGELKPTKTHGRRTVEIVPPLRRDLDVLRPVRPGLGQLVAPNEDGGFLDLNNWRPRVWDEAVKAAGIEKATPYDGRHTFASLLIHEGRSPLLVAAALGHASGETTWRHYAHVFDAARLAADVSMVDAIEAARTKLREKELRRSCADSPVRHLRLVV